ncbi:hypothetical protein D3C87_1663670 [compost metagenome]
MTGNVGDDHSVVADKVPGKTQPDIFVGTEAVQHQDIAGCFVRPALPGRDGHFADGHDNLVQLVQLGLGGGAQVVQPITDGRVAQPAPGRENRDSDNQ